MLEENAIAHGINERAKPFGLTNSFFPQGREETGEGFLPNIFNRLGRIQPRPQFDLDQCTEVSAKMLLRRPIAGTETFQVSIVK